MMTASKAINWNSIEDPQMKTFWDQNIRQFWVDEEIPLSDDKKVWFSNTLSDEMRDSYEKVVAVLTLLDTEQGGVGMSTISDNVEDLHEKAILQFMGFMEQMHAKSYSSIFSTLSTTERIDELFHWVETDEIVQRKIKTITKYYLNLKNNPTDKNLYLAMCASVFLETFLFYSGFFLPLYLAGQGKMVASGEIFNLIIRDESVHGLFVGYIAQKRFLKLSKEDQAETKEEIYELLKALIDIEDIYTQEIYQKINLEEDVKRFIRYNADKALMNIGYETYFNISVEDINPIVINGLNTETKNHDFFSTKGNGYIKTTNVTELEDDIFDF
jgi:ribonucleoside-diphosphate reductase beta chain